MTRDPKRVTTADALHDWRTAEQAAAVASRSKLAAEAAVTAAEAAAEAALASAEAAKSALASATLAEQSAGETAAAARLLVQHSRVDLVEAASDSALADVGEAEAHSRYHDASARAHEDLGNITKPG